MTSRATIAAFIGVFLAASVTAAQSAPLRVRRSQFTDRVDAGQPVGASAAIPPGGTATYWLEIANPGDPTQVTVVWRAAGRELLRQTLTVGRSPRWRTWARHRLGGVRAVDVEVLDSGGRVLQRDSLHLSITRP